MATSLDIPRESPRATSRDAPADTLVTFLPHRLNRQPVVVRGLTADELWICVGLSAAVGVSVGVPLAIATQSIAVVPTAVVAGVALGVFVGGGFLRRQKRGRPDTWLHRQLQWRLVLRYPAMAHLLGGSDLITRSGWWTTRRTRTRTRTRTRGGA